ncbi:MAG: hypothetical protein AAFO04_16750 [Cyanobacteria bacterium J06592_8]
MSIAIATDIFTVYSSAVNSDPFLEFTRIEFDSNHLDDESERDRIVLYRVRLVLPLLLLTQSPHPPNL